MDIEEQLDEVCRNLETGVRVFTGQRRDLYAARLLSDGLVAIITLRARALQSTPPSGPPPTETQQLET